MTFGAVTVAVGRYPWRAGDSSVDPMTATHDGAAVRRVVPRWQSRFEPILVVSTVGTLAAGGIAWLVGWHAVADGFWIAGTLAAVIPALVWMLVALRRGRAGVDLIAVLSLVGTLLVGEYLAGALIAVMLAGGRALEAAAERRASHDLRALLERAPRSARRRVGTEISVIPLAEVSVDDLIVVGPGEVVPVDGRITDSPGRAGRISFDR